MSKDIRLIKVNKLQEIYVKMKKYIDCLFLIMFALKYLVQFLGTTSLSVSSLGLFFSISSSIADITFILSIVILLMVSIFFEKVVIFDKILAVIVLLVSVIYVMFSDNSSTEIVEFLIITVLAINKSYKKILFVTIIEGCSIMIIYMLLSQLGIIDDYVSPVGRHALGMIYCTDCGAHILFLVIAYVIYSGFKMRLKNSFIMLVTAEVLLFIVNAKTAFLCVVMIMIGLFINKYNKKMLSKFKWIMLFIYPILFGVFVLLIFLYSKNPRLFPDNTLTARLYYSKLGFEKYGITLFARNIYQNGSPVRTLSEGEGKELNIKHFLFAVMILIIIVGILYLIKREKKIVSGLLFIVLSILLFSVYILAKNNYLLESSNVERSVEYFYLDSSFIQILLKHGIVVVSTILILVTYMQYKAFKAENYIFMFIMSVIVLDCTIEHHMMDISYNMIFLLALTDVYEKSKN